MKGYRPCVLSQVWVQITSHMARTFKASTEAVSLQGEVTALQIYSRESPGPEKEKKIPGPFC